jgi:hypothetical protein
VLTADRPVIVAALAVVQDTSLTTLLLAGLSTAAVTAVVTAWVSRRQTDAEINLADAQSHHVLAQAAERSVATMRDLLVDVTAAHANDQAAWSVAEGLLLVRIAELLAELGRPGDDNSEETL